MLSCEMVNAEFPELVSVTVCEALVLRARPPNARDVGFEDRCRTWAIPVPESGALTGEFGALLVRCKTPARLPAEFGSRLTVNVDELPGTRLSGKAIPLALKPEPETVA